jgi:hypothetical protein
VIGVDGDLVPEAALTTLPLPQDGIHRHLVLVSPKKLATGVNGGTRPSEKIGGS